jgi:hypothetical protein
MRMGAVIQEKPVRETAKKIAAMGSASKLIDMTRSTKLPSRTSSVQPVR